MTELRIFVADDHEIVRRGLRALIEAEPDWQLCGEAANGRDAVELARDLTPDVIILDISMPELNGLDAARQLRKLAPKSEILILTMHESEELMREVLAAGARGYVLKSDATRDLVAAISALRRHQPFFASSVSGALLDGYLKGSPPESAHCALTAREREILQMLAEGKSNKDVAAALDISVKTAETHRTNIMRKLKLSSFSGLVRYAVRNKIIQA